LFNRLDDSPKAVAPLAKESCKSNEIPQTRQKLKLRPEGQAILGRSGWMRVPMPLPNIWDLADGDGEIPSKY